MEQAARLIANPRPGGEQSIFDTAMSAFPALGCLRHHRVPDDRMAPMLRAGDWATVDTSDRRPSPPGVFVVWSDAEGHSLRTIEVAANSAPLLVRISAGADRATIRLKDICIEGRVCGLWKELRAERQSAT